MNDSITLKIRTLALAAVILPLLGFAFGRYHGGQTTTTTKTETQQTIDQHVDQHQTQVQQAQQTDNRTVDQHQTVDTYTTTTKKKDGTVVIKKHTHTGSDTHQQDQQAKTEKTSTDTSTKVDTQIVVKTVTETKTVTAPGPKWRVTGLVGLSVHDLSLRNGINPGPLVYGAAVQHQFIGPISAGAWGLSNGSFGLALTLEF